MNNDEIMEMVRIAAQGEPASGRLCCELFAKAWTPFFERFAAMVSAAERERCLSCYSPDDTATDWADKIRALKDEVGE